MEHDSGLFGIHKSVWQDWPCILRAVRVGLSVKHKPSAGRRNNGGKKYFRGTTKETKNVKSSTEVLNIQSPFDVFSILLCIMGVK